MRSPEALRAHLLDELLPLWITRGIDRVHGGFWSRLDASLDPVPDPAKRLRVQTRFLYVLSCAAARGAADAQVGATQALDLLRDRFWDAEHGGFHTTVAHAGEPLDRRKDLYDHAFALLALGAYAAVEPDSDALELARRTRLLLEGHLADPEHGGFFEGGDARWQREGGVRRQNPHMHLLEAYLTLASVDGDAAWVEGAIALVALCESRFFDDAHGVLREHFGPDWSRLDDARGRTVEPGHHFEWVSLLAGFEELTGRRSPLSEKLFRFGREAGIDPEHGGVFDEVDVEGRVITATKRLWPQTEYVRALASLGDLPALRRALDDLFARYLDPVTHGWREHVTREGEPCADAMNATSVYHVWTALDAAAEALEEPDRSGSRASRGPS